MSVLAFCLLLCGFARSEALLENENQEKLIIAYHGRVPAAWVFAKHDRILLC